jgi:hypothetical protein
VRTGRSGGAGVRREGRLLRGQGLLTCPGWRCLESCRAARGCSAWRA